MFLLLGRKSERDDYSVLLANIQFQVPFDKVCSTVCMLHYATVPGKDYCGTNHNLDFKSEVLVFVMREWG